MARITGTVKWFTDSKGYGFIHEAGTDRDIFVHFTAITGTEYKTLAEGQTVTFDLIDGPKMQQASNVMVKPEKRRQRKSKCFY